MDKEAIKENAIDFGKLTVRSVISAGVGIAFAGAGVVGATMVALSCKHKVSQIAVLALGNIGAVVGATTLAKVTDARIVDEYEFLDV